MALQKVMDSRSMQRKELTGMDENGKETYESHTIANINKKMTDEDFLKFNELMGALSENQSYMLYEKVSNKFEE